MLTTLTKKHPARLVKGAARILRKDITTNRLFASLPFVDVAENAASEMEILSLETISDAERLRTMIQAHASDGIITACELDEQIRLLNEIVTQAETGEVL